MTPQTATSDPDIWWTRPARAQRWHCFERDRTNDEGKPVSLCGDWKYHHYRKTPHREGLSFIENLHCIRCARLIGMLNDGGKTQW